jgi:hypothetical protein
MFPYPTSGYHLPLARQSALSQKTLESPKRFLDFLQEMRITVADIKLAYLGLLEGAKLPSTQRVMVTGDQPPTPGYVKRYAPELFQRLRYH